MEQTIPGDVLPARRSWPLRLVGLCALTAGASLLIQGQAYADPGGKPPRPPVTEFGSMPASVADDNRAMAPAKRTAWTVFLTRVRTDAADTTLATSRILSVPLYEQRTEYWCGPTTLAMVAQYLGVGFAGSTVIDKEQGAATLLGTTVDGTAWYGADNVPSFPKSSWYPMEDAINYRLYHAGKSTWYDHVTLPNVPTSAEEIDFRNRLTFDIDHNYPGEDNQNSAPGFEIGFQPYGAWQHWWTARGYASDGETTYFNDPAGWSDGRMSHAKTRGDAHTVVEALGGRGYIW